MISSIRGIVSLVSDNSLLIETKFGVGYSVLCSKRTIYSVCKEALPDTSSGDPSKCSVGFEELINNYDIPSKKIEAYLMTDLLVKQDKLQLIGFADNLEKKWFKKLTSVQGVGSKAAISILSSIGIKDLCSFIKTADKSCFNKIEGVGPKIAARIITELEKFAQQEYIFLEDEKTFDLSSGSCVERSKFSKKEDAVFNALKNLGYSSGDAENTLHKMKTENMDGDISFESSELDKLIVYALSLVN